jgi:hypothetical protein
MLRVAIEFNLDFDWDWGQEACGRSGDLIDYSFNE